MPQTMDVSLFGYDSCMSLESEVEAYLHLHIPLSAYMGASVLLADDDSVRIRFPLEPNINHRQTVFGGSESSAAILCAWSLLWVRFRGFEVRPRLVIRSNSFEYTRPIESEFVARTLPVEPREWDKCLAGLERHGVGRIQIRAAVEADGDVCGEFVGTFVAIGGKA